MPNNDSPISSAKPFEPESGQIKSDPGSPGNSNDYLEVRLDSSGEFMIIEFPGPRILLTLEQAHLLASNISELLRKAI